MKIRIIGCSGTGKSYLAKGLSEKYGIPHYDLDRIQWDDSTEFYGAKMPIDRRDRLLGKMLAKDDWIIEGVYYKWVMKSFEDADVIYVLQVPRRVYKYRIIKRFIKRRTGLEKGKKETVRSMIDLLKWTDTFQKENWKYIQNILEQNKEKVTYIESSRKVRKLLKENSDN